MDRHSKEHIDKTFFFNDNLTDERYLHLLCILVVPDLIQAFLDLNNAHKSLIIFQQDRALQERIFQETFNRINGRKIGRRGPICGHQDLQI